MVLTMLETWRGLPVFPVMPFISLWTAKASERRRSTVKRERIPDHKSSYTPLIADDHAVIRKMARLTLQRFPQFEVCGEAEDGVQAVDQAKKANPDMVILNVVIPYLHGFEVARETKKETPQAAIVILSTHAWALFLSLHFRRLRGYRLR